jgi:RimJ/RimL family protein N-acetyltransferase
VRLPYRELRTGRLRLRPPAEVDAPAVFASFAADPEVTRYLTWRPHRTLDDAEAALAARRGRLAQGAEYSWILERAESPGVIGVVSAWPADGAVELGFVLARAHWGQGLATEAVVAVRDWALDAGAQRVWATCDLENRASARVLEKAGFERLGNFERGIVRPNLSPEPRPSLLYERSRPGGPG